MQSQNKKILVFMSGGVDSSVAAALLVKAGYDVTGVFAVDYDDPASPGSCWHPDYEDALRVAAKLGIKLLRWDFKVEYKKLVLDYMYKEYKAGRTPNPDVLCNKYVKFGVWLKRALELGFDQVATGHYAKIVLSFPRRRESKSPLDSRLRGNDSEGVYHLLESKDANKDQTYFLHQLNQKQLDHIIFPIGDYTKDEVRKLAKKFKLPTAEKEESMGICFIGEVPMKEFLQKKIKIKKGKIITGAGEVVGEHDGLAFYTIGQRIGLSSVIPAKAGIQSHDQRLDSLLQGNDNTKPLYVIDKNIKMNELVVGRDDDPLLYKKEIVVEKINWISGQAPEFPLKCKVRLRHRQPLQDCHCEDPDLIGRRSNLLLKFTKPQRAVTPGQFAVLYLPAEALAKEGKDGECLGGGIIK